MAYYDYRHTRRMLSPSLLGVLSGICPMLHATAAWGTTQTLATTGQTAPGNNGGSFVDLGDFFHAINNNGQVAFTADVDTNNDGFHDETSLFLSDASGSLTPIIRPGDAAPGTGGGTLINLSFVSPITLRFNQAGQAVFKANVDTNSDGFFNEEGFFLADPDGTLSAIARSDDPAPIPDSAFLGFPFIPPPLNNAGQTVFMGHVDTNNDGELDESSLFLSNPGAPVAVVARPGDPVGNNTFVQYNLPAAINDAGQTAFRAAIDTTGNGQDDQPGLFIANPNGSFTTIAHQGQAAPGGNGGIITNLATTSPVLNNTGQAAFRALVDIDDNGVFDEFALFAFDGESLAAIARSGQPIPSLTDATFARTFGLPVLNNTGQTAFEGSIDTDADGIGDASGLFRANPDAAITPIAIQGQTAPDGNGALGAFMTYDLNTRGVVAYHATLANTAAPTSDDQGIYLADGIDTVPVIRKGNGVIRIASTGLNLNDKGQVSYLAQFDDGTQKLQLFTPTLQWRHPGDGLWDDPNNWTLGLPPTHVHEAWINPETSLTVIGPSERTTVDRLYIGGDLGIATLALHGGELIAHQGIVVQASGVLTGEAIIGSDVTNQGVVLADNLRIFATLTNHGLISGAGLLGADGTTNTQTGQIRAASEQHLTIDGGVHNDGLIKVDAAHMTLHRVEDNTGSVEVANGLLEILSNLVNQNGRLEAVDSELVIDRLSNNDAGKIDLIRSTLRTQNELDNDLGSHIAVIDSRIVTQNDLVNTADSRIIASNAVIDIGGAGALLNEAHISLIFGTNFVLGHALNAATGEVIITGNAQAAFTDDVANQGQFKVADGSTVVFLGSYTGSDITGLGDVFIEGNMSPDATGGAMAVGGSLTFRETASLQIQLTDPQQTTHDQVNVTGSVALDGTLNIEVPDTFDPEYGDAFEVLTYSDRDGVFTQVNGGILSPVLALGQFYNLDGHENALTLLATAPGDANGDLIVDISDFGILAGNINQPGTWETGDFDGNGMTNIFDFGLLAANFNGDFNTLTAAAAALGIATIPEPGTATLLALTAMGTALSHRRRV